jgi:hypothetical protein
MDLSLYDMHKAALASHYSMLKIPDSMEMDRLFENALNEVGMNRDMVAKQNSTLDNDLKKACRDVLQTEHALEIAEGEIANCIDYLHENNAFEQPYDYMLWIAKYAQDADMYYGFEQDVYEFAMENLAQQEVEFADMVNFLKDDNANEKTTSEMTEDDVEQLEPIVSDESDELSKSQPND